MAVFSFRTVGGTAAVIFGVACIIAYFTVPIVADDGDRMDIFDVLDLNGTSGTWKAGVFFVITSLILSAFSGLFSLFAMRRGHLDPNVSYIITYQFIGLLTAVALLCQIAAVGIFAEETKDMIDGSTTVTRDKAFDFGPAAAVALLVATVLLYFAKEDVRPKTSKERAPPATTV